MSAKKSHKHGIFEQLAMFEAEMARKQAQQEKEQSQAKQEQIDQLHHIVLQLKVTLQWIRPPIWRRILVPADTPFRILHEIIQHAFEWEDEHLYSFEIPLPDRKRVLIDNEGAKNPFAFPDFGGTEHRHEATTLVGEMLQKKRAKCLYWYDFRVDWKHDIVVEDILPRENRVHYPICIKGKRAAPPEDCGGPWRYIQFLEALRDPKHPDRKERDWLYEEMNGFDPEEFSLDSINEELRRPYMTLKEYEKLWKSRFPA